MSDFPKFEELLSVIPWTQDMIKQFHIDIWGPELHWTPRQKEAFSMFLQQSGISQFAWLRGEWMQKR